MPGPRPRVREIDVHERRAPAEADPPLEAARSVDAGVGVEDRVQRLDHLGVVHVGSFPSDVRRHSDGRGSRREQFQVPLQSALQAPR